MTHEGMVHALREIHRVLKSGGRLVDLRPNRRLDGGRRREVLAKLYALRGRRAIPVGVIEEGSFSDDEAADRAVRWALRRGLFTPESSTTVPFRVYFRDLAVADDFLAARTTARVEPAARHRLERLTARRRWSIVSVETLRLNILRKI